MDTVAKKSVDSMDKARATKQEPEKADGSALARNRQNIPTAQISPDPENRLINEHDDEFVAFAESIRLFGILQPLHVRVEGDGYVLVDGERRWRAAKRIGLPVVPCEI